MGTELIDKFLRKRIFRHTAEDGHDETKAVYGRLRGNARISICEALRVATSIRFNCPQIYEFVFVAGSCQLRIKTCFAGAVRAASTENLHDAGLPELTPIELLAVTAILNLQPATRLEISRLVGREISRDIIVRLKYLDHIDAGRRAPKPGAPFAYVTTKKLLEVFGVASLRDPPRNRKARGRRLTAALEDAAEGI